MNNKSRIKNIYKYFTKGRYGGYEGVPCQTGFSNWLLEIALFS